MLRRVAVFISALVLAISAHANPIQDENKKTGSSGWKLLQGRSTDIEGYASLTSVNIGQPISFFVSTTSSTYDIEIYRMGYYGGAGGREVFESPSLNPFLAMGWPA